MTLVAQTPPPPALLKPNTLSAIIGTVNDSTDRGAHFDGPGAFAGTRWSVVVKARSKDLSMARKALSELCSIYWYPLYAFARRSGCNHHEAEDITQGLFLHLISKDGLSSVDPRKGKFRSFLLIAMKHFMANEWHRSQAQKRGGGKTIVSIDMGAGEGRYESEPVDVVTPESLYDRGWAMTVLQTCVDDMEEEYCAKGKREAFNLLKDRIIGETGSEPYSVLAEKLNMTEGNVKVSIHRLRRRFGEILRDHVAQTVESAADVDEELRYLISCFGGALQPGSE